MFSVGSLSDRNDRRGVTEGDVLDGGHLVRVVAESVCVSSPKNTFSTAAPASHPRVGEESACVVGATVENFDQYDQHLLYKMFDIRVQKKRLR